MRVFDYHSLKPLILGFGDELLGYEFSVGSRFYTNSDAPLRIKSDGPVSWKRFSLPLPKHQSMSAGRRSKMEDAQRRTPRFPFKAPAEIICADLVETTRVTELSLYGCFLESTSPLQRGSRIKIKIMAEGPCFEATASVLYAQPTLGMGIAFRAMEPQSRAILQEWLRQSLDEQNTRPSIDDP